MPTAEKTWPLDRVFDEEPSGLAVVLWENSPNVEGSADTSKMQGKWRVVMTVS